MPSSRTKRSNPMTLLEFSSRFSTDEACAQYLFKRRWPNGWQCPKCGRSKAYYVAARGLWECASCGRQTSVTAGTVLHGTRTPLRLWFLAMFLMVSDKRGISSVALAQRIGITQTTAWSDLQKLRRSMEERERKYLLKGQVALSECVFGDPKEGGRRTRNTLTTPVLAALSQTAAGGPAFLRATVLNRLDRDSVRAAVEETISKGAIVLTDRLQSYFSLTTWGYEHERIPAKERETAAIRAWSRTIISNARAFIAGTYHGVSEKHLPRYLCEYEYRFNRRFRLNRIFDGIVTAAAQCKPWTYADIIEKPKTTP